MSPQSFTPGRDLHFHPHAHCIVTGGGLARDGSTWVSAAQDFRFPVHVLGALFRGKFLDALERLRARGLLRGHLDDRAARRRRARLYDQSWVVYAKRPFGDAEQVYQARAKQLLSKGDQAPPAVRAADADRSDERADGLPWSELFLVLTGVDLKICPVCGRRSVVRLPLPADVATCRGPPGAVSNSRPN